MSDHLSSVTSDALHEYLKIGRVTLDHVLRKPEQFYRPFQIEKKGKVRTIRAPISPLKDIQRTLLKGLYDEVRWLKCLHGGIPGKSVITNARQHVGRYLVVTYDLSDFFPSTTEDMVRDYFMSMNFRSDLTDTLVRLVTVNGSLPLGAPTSMAIANVVFRPSDLRLLRLCEEHDLTYTRYVDDIAISGMRDFRDLTQAVRGNIEMLGYKVNPRKIQIAFGHDRQVVTGLVVNHVLSPTLSFIRETKTLIRRCRAEGPGRVADEHGLTVWQLKQMISGRVAFVRSVFCKRGRRVRSLLVGICWKGPERAVA